MFADLQGKQATTVTATRGLMFESCVYVVPRLFFEMRAVPFCNARRLLGICSLLVHGGLDQGVRLAGRLRVHD